MYIKQRSSSMKSNQNGFTIIELMIATIFFSMALLVVTAAIIQFSRMYYKGVITARTQERARAISEDIARSIQYSGTIPHGPGPQGAYSILCAGGRRYTYQKDVQLGGSQPHVLVADSDPSCSNTDTGHMNNSGLAGDATELMGENMQLLNLEVNPAGPGLYQIDVRVAYGQNNDMLDDKSACKALTLGGQFCAISELSTKVTRRL